ncbi:CheY-like chemotaxis protein [Bradyrhizobium sp. LM2.7]
MTPTILFVDDEPDLEALILQKFRRQLRDGLVTFMFARDGLEALESIERHPQVDMVVADINMPRMDGLSLLQKLQEAEDKKSTIIVSAYGDMSNIRTAMNRGAFDFLTKPIDFADLETTIQKTIRHVEVLREARRRQMEAERAHASLSRYFSPEIARRLAADVGGDGMEVQWRDVATIFTDITGFTSLVESVAPETLGELLNEYVGGMTEIVFAHEGTVAKIIGDAIQVLFNAPGDQPDYATRAVACAHDLDAWGGGFLRALEGQGRELRDHPHRRPCRAGAGRQFRRQPLLRLHRLWRYHQHRCATGGRQQASGHPYLRQCQRRGSGREFPGTPRGRADVARTQRTFARIRAAAAGGIRSAGDSAVFRSLRQDGGRRHGRHARLCRAGRDARRRCAGRLSPQAPAQRRQGHPHATGLGVHHDP